MVRLILIQLYQTKLPIWSTKVQRLKVNQNSSSVKQTTMHHNKDTFDVILIF